MVGKAPRFHRGDSRIGSSGGCGQPFELKTLTNIQEATSMALRSPYIRDLSYCNDYLPEVGPETNAFNVGAIITKADGEELCFFSFA